ncbi:MAG: helicase-exonuclease AddAB subunit AddB [Roseburia sp.]|nr:helicase-exonuclease AddAB subunit AddB [Roseburia sp.]
MSLRFYFGSSDEGKSKALYQEIIRRSKASPRRNFLILVPDQFTMQTQKQLVTMHPDGGILNIDVLSFGRLGHRILEEVGGRDIPVLDDTGKSLVLQKVAADLKDKLPVLGGFLHRQGYIHEVKSAISEFMQYGIGTEDMGKLIAFAEKRGALASKLKDLETLYKGFMEYIQGNFITTEETLDVLRKNLGKSRLIPGSVVVLDGFTGFTPIQNRLVQELMRLSQETIVTITMGDKENPYQLRGEQELFYLSKKTVADLERLAKEAHVKRDRGQDIVVPTEAEGNDSPAFFYLQQNLFRYGYAPYVEEQQELRLFEATDPREEVHQTALLIQEQIHRQGLAYRDIAVVIGDLEGYAPYVETEFSRLGIPCFIDRTRGIVLNPMIEYMKSVLKLYLKDFSYESVFHYLRSGLADMEPEEIDRLENYVLQFGIRGYRGYSRSFVHKSAGMETQEPLAKLNKLRERLMGQVEELHLGKRQQAKEYVNHMYAFLVENQVQQKLSGYEKYFAQEGDLSRAREYAQIYRLVMELLNQIYVLLGEEEISLQEFSDILEAGFGEIEVGTIPQNVDRVLVGDMERTRLRSVQVLFFLGVNDGNIPKNASKGGIISDMDREFLQESEFTLAPTPRQQMFIQRFYLYLNLTKPTKTLFLSCARMNSEGKSIRPAYLMDTLREMFPGLRVEYPQNRSILEQAANAAEGMEHLARTFREYAQGTLPAEEEEAFFTLYQAYDDKERRTKRVLIQKAAFQRYQDSPLSRAVARALYGKQLENSVTRLETYAACAYRHFLQYGLALKEREEFGFETVDMGNVYHGVLELFAGKLVENGLTWFDFSRDFAQKGVEEAVEAYAASYGDTVLYSSARNAYMITRMNRILLRTVLTLQKQLQRGVFTPEAYEVSFRQAESLSSVQVSLSEQEKMHLRGRIDRVDIAQDESHVYVKVIDYKSGDRHFDLAALYYGLQLQLVVYMNAAMELEARKHPDKQIVPAAMLYYHIDDPTVESRKELAPEEIDAQILEKLRTRGVVNSASDIVDRLDQYMETKSDVIPVEKKKDGSLSSRSSVMSEEELRLISDYVNRKLQSIGREILDGKISLNPYERGSGEACSYCIYKRVCGFDSANPGCRKRKLPELDRDEIFARMEEERENGNSIYP